MQVQAERDVSIIEQLPLPAIAMLPKEHVQDDLPNPDGRFLLHVPAKFSQASIERYGKMLSLADAQWLHVDRVISSYLHEYDAIGAKHLAALVVQSSHASKIAQDDPAYAAEYERLIEDENRCRGEILDLEARVFSQIEAVLSDQQLPRIAEVKLHRQRSVRPCDLFLIPEAGIDLRELVEHVLPEMHDDPGVEDVLAEYEQRVSPVITRLSVELMERRASLEWVSHRMIFDANGSRYARGSAERNVAFTQGERELRQLLAAGSRLEQRLAEDNTQYLLRLRGEVASTEWRMLRAAYDRIAYPDGFPDVTDPQPVVRMIGEHEAVEANARAAVLESLTDFESRYEQANDEVRNAVTAWYVHLSETRNWRVSASFDERINQAVADRQESALGFVRAIKGVVEGYAPDAVLSVLSRLEMRAASLSDSSGQ